MFSRYRIVEYTYGDNRKKYSVQVKWDLFSWTPSGDAFKTEEEAVKYMQALKDTDVVRKRVIKKIG